MEEIDVRPAAREVVEVLHKNKIPIDLAQSVFDESMFLINHNTVRYSPSASETSESKSEVDSLKEAAEPLHKILTANYTPHSSVIVGWDSVKVVSDELGTPLT